MDRRRQRGSPRRLHGARLAGPVPGRAASFRRVARAAARGGLGLAVAVVSLATAASHLAAQEVHGRLLTRAEGAPLVGAYLELARDGTPVATALSDAEGRFRVRAPEAGLYTLEVEYLGYATVTTEVEAGPPELAPVIVRLTQRAIELEGLVANAERQCDVPREVGARVVELWDEVSKVFQVAVVAGAQELYHFEAERWTRTLDLARLQVESEQRSAQAGLQRGSPFVSLPATYLAEHGYIQKDSTGTNVYLAPDPAVLLSQSFQDTHCFGLTDRPPEDGEEDWIGIRFEPRDADARDIEGTLWIESDGYGPRRLDYEYRNIPWPFRTDQVGGRLVFDRLPDGPWIVRQWRIRMPKVSQAHYRLSEQLRAQQRWFLEGLTEVGGQVVRALGPGGAMVRFGNPARLAGVMRNSRGERVADGRIALRGTHFRARTDELGNFALQDVPPGRYGLSWSYGVLDSLGLDPRQGVLELEGGETTRRELVVPSLPDAIVAACQAAPEGSVGEGSAILRGIVHTSAGVVPDSAEVRVTWEAEVDVSPVVEGLGVQAGRTGVLAPVGGDGRWVACGLPHDVPLTLEARWADARETPGSVPGELTLEENELRATAPLVLPPRAALARAIELEPLEVAVEGAIRDLRDIGVRQAELGRRFITFEEIRDDRFDAGSVMDLLERQNVPGVTISRAENGLACIHSQRYAQVAGGTVDRLCAAVYVDGNEVEPAYAVSIPPDAVAAMAFLRAFEAQARFGGGAEGGALFIWTHQGGGEPR